jgi:hypothetical protein
VRDKGEGIVYSNIYFSEYTKYYQRNGNRKAQPTFYKAEFKPYIEYGLTDIYTIGFSPSLQAVGVESGVSTDQNFALQYAEIYFKNNLYYSGNFAASLENVLEVPGFYSMHETPAFGKKDYFLFTKLNGGYGYSILDNLGGFFQIGAGVRNRFYDYLGDESGSQFKYDLTAGVRYNDNEYFIRYDSTRSLTGYKNQFNLLDRFGYKLDKIEISAQRHFNPITAFQLGYSFDVSGRSTGSGDSVKFSVINKF